MTRLAVAVALILAVAGVIYWRGGADQRAADLIEDAETYRDTRKAIEHATDRDLPDDAVLERLRRHAER
jgi:hypothetical protein